MTGNGKDHDNKGPDEGKVVRLPTLAERDRARREKLRADITGNKSKSTAGAPAKQPFLNIKNLPPFTRYMTLTFIIVHVAVFFVLDPATHLQLLYKLGFVPGYFTGTMGGDFQWYAPIGFLTHVAIHGSWFHLLMNATMMLALGMFFEKTFGTRATAIFFFACVFAGALLFLALNPFATTPVIGASGGLSGLFAALLLMMHDQGRIRTGMARGPWPLIAFWLVFMVAAGLLGGGSIAWQAHIGGFMAGAGLFHLMRTGRLKL